MENYIEIEQYEKKLMKRVVEEFLTNKEMKYISAIILTGSLGRNEASYLFDDDNHKYVLKSDVEIACVYKKNKLAVEIMIKKVCDQFVEDLNIMPIGYYRVKHANNFNASIVPSKYKSIFTYDFYNGSKTLWGRDYISEKDIDISQCDPYEAKRIVANRIGEMVYLLYCDGKLNDDYLRAQWKGKVVLAIVTGWLICEKKYKTSYRMQYKIVLDNQVDIESVVGSNFVEHYKKVFLFLRESGNVYEINDVELRKYVRSINAYFSSKKLLKSKVNSFSRHIKYMLKYMHVCGVSGLRGFEDRIIQGLLDEFEREDIKIIETAQIWHKVLY